MNYIYIILFLVAIIELTVIHSAFFKEEIIILDFLGGNNLFVLAFIILSIPQIFFETYSVFFTLLAVIAAGTVILIVLKLLRIPIKFKKKKLINKEIFFVVALLSLISVLFLRRTVEDIRSISDQGTYFTYSILLSKGDLSEVRHIKEQGIISEKVDSDLRGLRTRNTIFYTSDYYGPDTYYIHALSTWCIFPALWIKMFGLWKGMKSLTWMYYIFVLDMYLICKKIKTCKNVELLAISLFALSPLTMYIAKAGLSEIVFLLLVIIAIRYGICLSKNGYLITGTALGLVGYIHASVLIYLPIIVLILWITSLYYDNCIIANIVFLILYGLSVWYDDRISPIYIRREFARVGGRIIPANIDMYENTWIVYVLINLCCLFCIFISIVLIRWKSSQKPIRLIMNKIDVIKYLCLIFIVVRTIEYCYKIGFTDLYALEYNKLSTWGALRNTYVNKGVLSWSYLNITNILRLTGIAGFICVLFIKPSKHSIFSKLLYLVELYCLLYFLVFCCDTPLNYYASRYFAPVLLPVTTLVIAASLTRTKQLWYVMIGAMMYFKYFWGAFVTGAPLYGEYDYLKNALDNIPAGSIVLCNPESDYATAYLSENLRILNDNKVYSLDNINEILNYYSDEQYFVISDSTVNVPDGCKLITSAVYKSQWGLGNGGNGRYAVTNGDFDVPIYIYEGDTYNK